MYFSKNYNHYSPVPNNHNLINIDGDILYFNLHFCDKENFLDYLVNTRNMNELFFYTKRSKFNFEKRSKFNFEKSKIICKILKEIK